VSLLPYAVKAVQRGWHIFPCNPAGTICPERGRNIEKESHLIQPDRPWKIRWSEVATTDLSTVVAWWEYSPQANIGIACRPSGLLVVDCDMPKREYQLADTPWGYLHDQLGPLVDGSDVLREMCRRYGDDYERFERTYRVCTASLGLHLLYAWPEDVQASQTSPVPGLLDVRTNGGDKGGYVLAAGSQTVKGTYVVEADLPVAPAPPWLVELCREKPRPKPIKSHYSQPGGGGYNGLADKVRLCPEGNRSHVLYWAACAMDDDGADIEEALKILVPAAEECGLFDREAEATIKSAYRRSK